MESYAKHQGLAFYCSDMARVVASCSMPPTGSSTPTTSSDESSLVPMRTSRETLTDIANAYGSIYFGTHVQSAPIEYIWRSQRSRVALCFRTMLSLATIANDLLRHHFVLSQEDAAQDVVSLLLGGQELIPALTGLSMRQYAFHFVSLNCSNFPMSLFESVVDLSVSILTKKMSALASPRWIFLRTMLLFVAMKECVEDLAAGMGHGLTEVDKVLSMLHDWYKGFQKNGLDVTLFRPAACRASVCTGFFVAPYPSPEVCRLALHRFNPGTANSLQCTFPDVLTSFVCSDDWYLSVTAGHEGVVASVLSAL